MKTRIINPDVAATVNEIGDTITPYIISLRRDFHAHPELSKNEARTSARIKEELTLMGLPFEQIAGTHGVVGILESTNQNSAQGDAVVLRADIDALPILEETNLPYKSQTDGIMHACGHDAHAAMLLGAASILQGMRSSLSGNVLFCFQGAEEINEEADAAVRQIDSMGGASAAYGLHIWATVPTGYIQLTQGALMAGIFMFKITLRGQGGHGSRPDLSRDPIRAACDLALRLQSLTALFTDPRETAVVHVGHVTGGNRPNIFPDTAEIEGAARFFSYEMAERLLSLIQRAIDSACLMWDVAATFEHTELTPPVVNDSGQVQRLREVAPLVRGLSAHDQDSRLLGSDNMSLFLQRYGGVYGLLGCMNASVGANHEHHNAMFDIDEAALPMGAKFLAMCALQARGR